MSVDRWLPILVAAGHLGMEPTLWFRYWLRCQMARSWPSAQATIGSAASARVGIWSQEVLVGYSFTAGGEYYGGSMKRWLPKLGLDDYMRQLKERKLSVRYRRANPDQSIILPEDWPAFT